MLFPTIAHTNHGHFHKPYELSYELRPGYLYVKLRSDANSYNIARQYWNEIMMMAARCNCKRVLVDKDIGTDLSTADVFRMASEVAFEFRSVKLAVCDRHSSQQDIEFGETVAANRGLDTRSFNDIDDARHWLLDDNAARSHQSTYNYQVFQAA